MNHQIYTSIIGMKQQFFEPFFCLCGSKQDTENSRATCKLREDILGELATHKTEKKNSETHTGLGYPIKGLHNPKVDHDLCSMCFTRGVVRNYFGETKVQQMMFSTFALNA